MFENLVLSDSQLMKNPLIKQILANASIAIVRLLNWRTWNPYSICASAKQGQHNVLPSRTFGFDSRCSIFYSGSLKIGDYRKP